MSRLTILHAAGVALLFVALATPEARADRRIFTHTYPYQTLPSGGFEIEHYLDAELKREDDPSTEGIIENGYRPRWTHQLELEYGITDRLDFGLYTVLEQKAYGSLKMLGPKLRTRYRFFEEGDYFVDPAIYLEVAYFGDEVEIEQRLILGRRIGQLELALNLKLEEEIKLASGEAFELIFVPSLGAGYHLTSWLAVSVEYFFRLKVEEGEVDYVAHYLGPAISVAGRHFWWTLSFMPQLSSVESRATFHARSMFAVVF